MELVEIEAGTFEMGSAKRRHKNVRPVHTVRISKDFFLGKTEVTQAQWRTIMATDPRFFKGADRPVDSVTWNEIQDFLRILNAAKGDWMPGFEFRLPYEAEWEYACRAGTVGTFHCSDHEIKQYAWIVYNSGGETKPVGTRRPNPWGLHDMLGNLYEWCHDFYDKKEN